MKALALTIALFAAGIACADSLRSQIDAASSAITLAIKSKDLPTLQREMRAATTKDFKYMENGQTQSFSQMMDGMKAGLRMMDKLTVCSAKVLSLKQKGSTAVCTMQHTMVGTMKGKDKKTHTMSFAGVSEDTYINQGGKWKMSSMNWKSMKQTMDGKPIQGMGG